MLISNHIINFLYLNLPSCGVLRTQLKSGLIACKKATLHTQHWAVHMDSTKHLKARTHTLLSLIPGQDQHGCPTVNKCAHFNDITQWLSTWSKFYLWASFWSLQAANEISLQLSAFRTKANQTELLHQTVLIARASTIWRTRYLQHPNETPGPLMELIRVMWSYLSKFGAST